MNNNERIMLPVIRDSIGWYIVLNEQDNQLQPIFLPEGSEVVLPVFLTDILSPASSTVKEVVPFESLDLWNPMGEYHCCWAFRFCNHMLGTIENPNIQIIPIDS